jgi:hypothetical protein
MITGVQPIYARVARPAIKEFVAVFGPSSATNPLVKFHEAVRPEAYCARVLTLLWEFRGLFLEVRDEAPPGWGEEIIVPWLTQHPESVAELRTIGRPENRNVRVLPNPHHFTVLEGLYAVSRVVDVLIAPHQPVNDDPALLAWTTGRPWWVGQLPAVSAWRAFCAGIGATLIDESAFHPFFHEVVAVEPAEDPDEPPSLVEEHWPGALIDSMLLVRSGVTVRAGANVMDPSVAARSCLYFSWWRRNRVVRDLSHGWGSNSQWGTDFRRDYIVDGQLHYNVDRNGRKALAADDTPLEQRRELMRYRHSVRTDLGDDCWPYDETFVEPRP